MVLKNNRKLAGLSGVIAASLVLFAVVFSYIQILTYYPKFSIFSNAMSELGVGPNMIIFNSLVLISCFFIGLFFFGWIDDIKQNEENVIHYNICLIIGIYSLVGLFLIGVFPMDDIGKTNIGHALGAIIYWSGSISFWGILTFITRKNVKFNRFERIFVELAFLSWAIFLSSFIISIFILPMNNTFPVVFQWNAHLFTIFAILVLAIEMLRD